MTFQQGEEDFLQALDKNMKIHKNEGYFYEISNLYSYSYAKANFEDFNVFVGHNVAGKSNLVRIVQILVKHPEDDD
jgi:energy-coupling factor transporter ATP-binding protein EcfA2